MKKACLFVTRTLVAGSYCAVCGNTLYKSEGKTMRLYIIGWNLQIGLISSTSLIRA